MYNPGEPKRFVASGALNAAGEKAEVCGIAIRFLSGDATVAVYDGNGAEVTKRKFAMNGQPGTGNYYPAHFLLRDGGYVEIVGTAEAFVYLV